MKAVPFGALFLAVLLGFSGLVVSTAPRAQAASTGPTRSFVLYGAVTGTSGWGFSATSIANPGPTLTVNVGDTVSLELVSHDGVTHTWFIDYDNSTTRNGAEPISNEFNGTTGPVWFNFTVDGSHLGTYTYRCSFHPTQMTGLIQILPAPSFVLYGSATGGWGFGPSNISNPGPTLTVTQGKTYTFELVSQDGQAHTFFVDLNANGAPDPGEPLSPTFGGSSQPSVIDWSWTVSTSPGNYTYYCSIHLAAMKGALVIRSSSPSSGPGAPPDYTIYAAVVLIIAIVAIVAAVIIRRRPKSPPSQPPVQPPQRQG